MQLSNCCLHSVQERKKDFKYLSISYVYNENKNMCLKQHMPLLVPYLEKSYIT